MKKHQDVCRLGNQLLGCFALVVTMAAVSGCSHVVYLPNSPRQIPSVAQKVGGGHVGYQLGTSAVVAIFDDVTTTPPLRSQDNNISVAPGGGIDIAYSLFENSEIYLTDYAGLRYQLFRGDKPETSRATIFGGFLVSSGSSYSSVSYTTSTTTTSYSASTKLSAIEVGFSYGILKAPDGLLYGTAVYRSGKGQTTIDVTNSPTKYDYSDTWRLASAVVGYQYGESVYWRFEGGLSYVDWDRSSRGFSPVATGEVGYNW